MKTISLSLLVFSCLIFAFQKQQQKKLPNIVVILADDLGYSDLGCFGSEISTPNIDALAKQGQIFSHFYTAATCSPSRAMLLTGTDHHLAGLGNMAERVKHFPEQSSKPGYEGYLNDRVVSVAQLLKDAGYHTYIAGKWHLGTTADQSPTAKGFERSYSLLEAAANNFHQSPDVHFWQDGQFASYPDGQFSTDLYTDKMIQFIREGRKDQPFFLFAAYTAPHWPLQAPLQYINKYKGKYDIGYDSLRKQRFRRSQDKGIVEPQVKLPELPAVKGSLYSILRNPLVSWTSLDRSQQEIEARKMEIYAAMIDNLDHNIGRLVHYLKEIGEFENTFFVFFSDNGPDVFEFNETPDKNNPYPYMGTASSFIAYGPQWSHASSGVNSFYKGYSAEGGIHTPMIVKMPGQKQGRGIVTAFSTVMDLAPTFLELAGTTYPAVYQGRQVTPYKGASLLPFLERKKTEVHDENYVMGWELFGRCAVRKGKWKIRKMEPPFGKGEFELFDIEKDPTESHDLSSLHTAKYKEMVSHWEQYVRENGVILVDR